MVLPTTMPLTARRIMLLSTTVTSLSRSRRCGRVRVLLGAEPIRLSSGGGGGGSGLIRYRPGTASDVTEQPKCHWPLIHRERRVTRTGVARDPHARAEAARR